MPQTPNDPKEAMSHPLTKEGLQREIQARVSRIDREFSQAFKFLNNFPKSVTVFGSSRSNETNPHYRQARELAAHIVRELGYAVITGGSAGIMEAANRGAKEAGGTSVGLGIKLPQVQAVNQYLTASLEFSYFFVRKVALSFAAEAYLFFPGGFGTLDEFFEILTLVQTHKIRQVPIFLIGRDFWEPLDAFIRSNVYTLHNAVDRDDLLLYRILENNDEIIRAIKEVPVHDGRRRRKSFTDAR